MPKAVFSRKTENTKLLQTTDRYEAMETQVAVCNLGTVVLG